MNTRIFSVALAVLVASAGLAWAEDDDDDLIGVGNFPGEFSGSVNFTNEYLFRGISQTTDGVPAIQGSIDWAHESGIYAGVWASNVFFTDASIEMDWYGGWSGTVADVVDVGAGGIYYYYPSSASSLNYDYFEFTGSVGHDWGPLATTLELYYSPNYFGDSGDAVYISTNVDVPIWKSLALNLHHGHQWIDDNSKFGTPNYSDFSVGVSATILGFDTSLAWSDTDMSRTDCFGGTSFCNSAVIFSVGRSL